MHKLIVFEMPEGHFSFSDLDEAVHLHLLKSGVKPFIGKYNDVWCVYYEFDTDEEAALFKLTHL